MKKQLCIAWTIVLATLIGGSVTAGPLTKALQKDDFERAQEILDSRGISDEEDLDTLLYRATCSIRVRPGVTCEQVHEELARCEKLYEGIVNAIAQQKPNVITTIYREFINKDDKEVIWNEKGEKVYIEGLEYCFPWVRLAVSSSRLRNAFTAKKVNILLTYNAPIFVAKNQKFSVYDPIAYTASEARNNYWLSLEEDRELDDEQERDVAALLLNSALEIFGPYNLRKYLENDFIQAYVQDTSPQFRDIIDTYQEIAWKRLLHI